MRRGDREYLFDMLEACRRIQRYLSSITYEDFLQDEQKQDAVVRNLEILGEAAKKDQCTHTKEISERGLEEHSQNA